MSQILYKSNNIVVVGSLSKNDRAFYENDVMADFIELDFSILVNGKIVPVKFQGTLEPEFTIGEYFGGRWCGFKNLLQELGYEFGEERVEDIPVDTNGVLNQWIYVLQESNRK